jgi:hypothetical protein
VGDFLGSARVLVVSQPPVVAIHLAGATMKARWLEGEEKNRECTRIDAKKTRNALRRLCQGEANAEAA